MPPVHTHPRWLALSILLLGGCGTDEAPVPTRSVTDSAGIEIVTNTGPTWSEGEGWSVASAPDLSIGSRDGPPETLFGSIRAVGWLGDGRIFVADEQARSVRVFSDEGAYLGSAGREGLGPGELQAFMHVGPYRGDSLFVSDYAQSRISVFGPDLEFARSVRHPSTQPFSFVRYALSGGQFVTYEALPLNPEARGLVPQVAPVTVMAPDGSDTTTFGRFVPTVRRVVADGSIDPMLPQPTAAFHAAGQRILWTRGDALEFVEVDADGTMTRIVRTSEPPIPADEAIVEGLRADYMEWTLDARPGMSPQQIADSRQAIYSLDHYPTLPRTSADMLVDPLGNRWIGRYHFEGFPAEEWEVFGPSGTWLGLVRTPPGLEVHAVGFDQVIGVATDELGTPFVQIHRLTR